MQDQTLANGRKPGSSDRNEKEVARMDHDAQKQRDQKTEQGVEEKDKDARRQMGIEHPGAYCLKNIPSLRGEGTLAG